MIRKILYSLGAMLLVLIAARVLAETNTLTAMAPAENTDGSVLTDLASIRIYYSQDGGAFEVIAEEPFTEAGGMFSYQDERLDGVHCYKLTAVAADGDESDFSNEACKTVDTILPKAVTNLVVN